MKHATKETCLEQRCLESTSPAQAFPNRFPFTAKHLRRFPMRIPRGVAFEALGQFEDAIRDYKTVLAAAPDDPAAWNNLGNATAGDAAAYICVQGLRVMDGV